MKLLQTRNTTHLVCCIAATLLFAFFLSGCVVKDFGNKIGNNIKGDYYLQRDQIEEGQASFKDEVRQNPNSGSARYYYGRFLLQNNENKAALQQLKKAVQLEPKNVRYRFWTGVAYGVVGDKKSEESSYRAVLRMDKKHLQSIIYLGHNLLERKRYSSALHYYNQALKIWPQSPASLYNRALILKQLDRTPEEKRAWLDYLALYPSGAMARRATEHLNGLGDFSFRNHHLGARTITIEKIWFEPLTVKLHKASQESLQVIGAIMENRSSGTLQVVAYQKNNNELARKKAVNIKRYLLKEFPEISAKRIGVSWFDQPQMLTTGKKRVRVDESISFFITESKKKR